MSSMCCDLGLFDFFRRSSRTRSQSTTATPAADSVSASGSVSHASEEDVPQQRQSMPPNKAPVAKLESMSSTVSGESSTNGESDGGGNDVEKEPESLGSVQNYEIVRELGRGATAIVSLGRQKDGDHLVALKVFKTSLLKKMREVKRVGRRMVVSTALDKVQVEIAIMKKLRHPNLLNLLEVVDDDTETLVLMLEYAPYGQIMHWDSSEKVYRANPRASGGNNDNNAEEDHDFDEDTLRSCVRQLLLGLEYLHENNICHRDLKPENILLSADGVYKIADFGVAHLFEETEAASSDAAAGAAPAPVKKKGYVSSTAGTYAFMGPETLTGMEYSAFAADVWALGITLHALAFGTIPYYHEDPMELFEMIQNQPLGLDDGENDDDDNNNNNDNSSSSNGNGNGRRSLSPGLSALLRGMLKKDPEKRWGIQKCKSHDWVLDGLNEDERTAFVNTTNDHVEVNPEEVANAVTKVTALNVILRVKMGANKWKRKARKSLEMKKRASLTGGPDGRDSFVADMKKDTAIAVEDNQREL